MATSEWVHARGVREVAEGLGGGGRVQEGGRMWLMCQSPKLKGVRVTLAERSVRAYAEETSSSREISDNWLCRFSSCDAASSRA